MKTYGDINCCACPYCGRNIRDLWEYSNLSAGNVIDCPYCEQQIQVLSVETVTEVVLKGNPKAEEVAA